MLWIILIIFIIAIIAFNWFFNGIANHIKKFIISKVKNIKNDLHPKL